MTLKIRSLIQLILIIFLVLLFNLVASAQVKERDLRNVEENIDGVYTPVIKEGSKISATPIINDSTKKIPVSKYAILNKSVNTNFEIDPIVPARMKGEPLVKLYRSYLKGGLGNYTTPLFEANFNSLRSKNFLYALNYDHLSSFGRLNDSISNGGFSNNKLDLSGKYFIDKHTVEGGFLYNRSVVNYYGIPVDYINSNAVSELVALDSKQRFNLFSTNATVSSNYTDSADLNHEINLKYYNLSDLFEATENNIKVDAKASKFYGKEYIVATAGNDLYLNSNKQDSGFNNLFTLGVVAYSKWNKLRFKFGGGVVIESKSESVSYPHFYPNMDVNYNIIDNILIPYAGITGNMHRNSYFKTTEINPFLSSTASLQNTNEKVKVYGGIRGSLSSSVSFNTSVSYSNVDNMAFFVNDTNKLARNKFTLEYDKVKVLNVHGEIAFQKFEKIRLLGQADYFKYDMTNLLYPWHKPTLLLTLTGKYNLKDKILVKADVFYQNQRKAIDYIESTDPEVRGPFPYTMKGFLDVNIGGEYRYTKHLSAFLNFNNIGAVKYSRWYNYPLQRFNLMGGVTYSF